MSSAAGQRFKVALRLSIQRLRNTAAKKEALNKKERRSIASLLEKGKIETARVRVETIVNEEIYIELLEVLELYLELCIARFGLIEQSREVDSSIAEAVSGIIHASPKTDIKELHQLSTLFLQHYGREYTVKCIDNADGTVPARIVNKLSIQTPSPELVDAYLSEIAKAYAVDWQPDSAVSAPGGPGKAPSMADIPLEERAAVNELPRTPPIAPSEAQHTVSIHATIPPPQITLQNPQAAAPSAHPSEEAVTPQHKQDQDFEALKKRFEALKKK